MTITTPQRVHKIGSSIANRLQLQLAHLIHDHGLDMKVAAEQLNAGVFDISSVIPGADGGDFEGTKFKLTLSLMPIGYEDGDEEDDA